MGSTTTQRMFLCFTTRRLSTQRLQLSDGNGASKRTFHPPPPPLGQFHFVYTVRVLAVDWNPWGQKYYLHAAPLMLPLSGDMQNNGIFSVLVVPHSLLDIVPRTCTCFRSWASFLLCLDFQDYIWLLILKLLLQLKSGVHRRYVSFYDIV